MVALFQLFAHLINLSDVVLDSKKIGFLYNHCRNKSETIIFTAVVMATVFLVLANGGTLSITCREGRGGRGGKVRMLHLSLADKHPTPLSLDEHLFSSFMQNPLGQERTNASTMFMCARDGQYSVKIFIKYLPIV